MDKVRGSPSGFLDLLRFSETRVAATKTPEYLDSPLSREFGRYRELLGACGEFLNVLSDSQTREAVKKLRAKDSYNERGDSYPPRSLPQAEAAAYQGGERSKQTRSAEP